MALTPLSLRAQRAPPSSSRPSRRSEVYVLVPHSPYSPCASGPNGFHHNPPTPLREHNMPIPESPVIKRKRSEGNLDETEQRAPEAKLKRSKVSTITNRTQGSSRHSRTVESPATEEFPNGFFYCHQCNKKRDSSGELRQSQIMLSATSSNTFPQSDYIALTTSGPLTRSPVVRPNIAGHVSKIVTGRT